MRDLKSPSNLSKQKKTFHYSVDISSLGGGEYYMMKETLSCPTFDTLNSWHFEDCNEKKGQIQSFYDNEFDPFSLPKASFLNSISFPIPSYYKILFMFDRDRTSIQRNTVAH